MLAEQRRAEDTIGARRIRGPVLAQIKVIDHLAADTPEPVRRELLTIGSHYQQFAHAKRGAELAVATGSALAAQELRRVRAVLRQQGDEHAVAELADHLRALTGG